MSYRFMRILVMFDLPVVTPDDRRNYRRFRKVLIKNGFVMMQESVYTKIILTPSAEASAIAVLRKYRPPSGLVQVLTITEKQFSRIEYITGTFETDVVNSDEKVIVL